MGALNLGVLIGIDPWSIFLISICGSIPFYLAHWEEYFTHSLVLGMFNGPTETETLAIILFLVTYSNGLSWWKESVTFFVGSSPFTMQRNQILVYLAIAMSLFTALQSVFSGLSKARAQGISVSVSFAQLVPISIVWMSTSLWIWTSLPLFNNYPTLFITSFGFVFSTLIGRCIVQRICNEPYRMFYPIIFPLVIAAANSLSRYILGYVTNQPCDC